MKITVQGNSSANMSIPSGLVLNDISASVLPLLLRKHGITITGKQARSLVKALNRYRKNHPEWVLVEVHSAQGEDVLIKL